jgi:SAM-dependent methyltransferase
VLAIDIDRNMLDVARDRLTKAGTTNCELVEGDAYELTTLAGRLVDFVFMANAFHGVPDQPRLAQAVPTIPTDADGIGTSQQQKTGRREPVLDFALTSRGRSH